MRTESCPCGAQDYRKCEHANPSTVWEALLRSECDWHDPVPALRDAVRLLAGGSPAPTYEQVHDRLRALGLWNDEAPAE